MTVQKIQKTFFRYGICILGILLTSLSTAVFYLVKLGSDPIQVMFSGAANTLGIPYGTVISLFNLAIGILMVLFARKYVKAALFLSVLCAGFFVDGYLSLLGNWITNELPIAVRILLGIFGCVIMCLGIYLYLLPQLGASPTEGMGLFIAEKLCIPYGKVRLALDILFTVCGWLLGGNLGAITVIAMLTTGPGVTLLEKVFHYKIVRA